MWTNKQVWEFDQLNENLVFDVVYVNPGDYSINAWKSKLAFRNSEIRDITVKTFDNLVEGMELWITNKEQAKLEKKFTPYLMAVMADIMIDEEISLNFRRDENCLVVSMDSDADVIDCKEFFEEFYHLATGFNFDIDTGIPDDETEAEIYLTRLQEEFDNRMKEKLGDAYLSGNNDPDSIDSK
ncbi:MAG: hypothetical protein ACE5DU_01490 [Nitrosopumilus sp.]